VEWSGVEWSGVEWSTHIFPRFWIHPIAVKVPTKSPLAFTTERPSNASVCSVLASKKMGFVQYNNSILVIIIVRKDNIYIYIYRITDL